MTNVILGKFCRVFKFSRRELGLEIVSEMQERIKDFSIPRGFAVIPVLCHLGGVTNAVYRKNYFYKIIDINDFIENTI